MADKHAAVVVPLSEESNATLSSDNNVLDNMKQEVDIPESVISNGTDRSIYDPSPISKLEKVRTRMTPLLLYVVSTAQFLDIGKHPVTFPVFLLQVVGQATPSRSC